MSQHGVCKKCGAENILNPKTGKVFCKQKCWLGGQPQPQQSFTPKPSVASVGKDDAKEKSIAVSYAKDVVCALIGIGHLKEGKDIVKVLEYMAKWFYEYDPTNVVGSTKRKVVKEEPQDDIIDLDDVAF